MTLNYSQCIIDQNDDPENDCFEPALYGIYSDVLNHAIVATDDCETLTFISAKGCAESSASSKRKDRFFAPNSIAASSIASKRRDRFFTADFLTSTNSIGASSMASSDMLSIAQTNDDDLSYLTEPDFDEEILALTVSNIGTVMQVSEMTAARPRKIIEFGNDEPSNLRSMLEEPNTLGLGVCREYGRVMSDIDIALNPPSAIVPILDSDDDCLEDAPLCIIGRVSFDSYCCDSSSNQLYANDKQ